MIIKNFLDGRSNLFAENRLLKAGFVVLLVMQVLSWSQLRTLASQQRETLIPLTYAGPMQISVSSAGDEYLLGMTRHVLDLVGNYTAATARKQFSELLRLFPPETYGEAEGNFKRLADMIERYSTVASRVTMVGDPKTDGSTIVVQAIKERLVNGVPTTHIETRFQITYAIRNGRFWVLSIDEAEKNQKPAGEKNES